MANSTHNDEHGQRSEEAGPASDRDVPELPGIEELRRTLDALPQAVFVDDSPTSCLYVNPAYRKLFGLDASERRHGEWSWSSDKNTRAEVDLKRQRLWTLGESYEVTADFTLPDGAKCWTSATVNATVGDDGQVVRATGVVTDVTDAVLAKKALESSEQRFRSLVTNAPDAIVGVDEDANIQIWNDTAAEMFGYTRDEILGRPVSLMVPPDLRGGHGALAQAFAQGPIERAPMRSTPVSALRKDGGELPVEISLAKVTDDGGQLVIATLRDVTDKLRVQTTRDVLNTRFRALTQNNRDAIFVVDKNFNITYASPASTSILGVTPDEFVGVNLQERFSKFHDEDRQRVADALEEVRAEPGSQQTLYYRAQHSDGSYRDLESRITNHIDEPGLEGLVFNLRDVTSETRAQAEHRRADARFRGLIQHNRDAIFVTDEDGVICER